MRPIGKPYDRVPQITFNGNRYDIGGFDFNTVADFTRFSSGDLIGGDRAYVTQAVSYPIIRPGYFITPKVILDATSYSLNNVLPASRPPSRTLPTLSLDSGLIFERESNLLGRSMTQTLEPRLFYVRTPYRDQSQFPVFDSGLADFNFAQIFTENRFVGHDRISDANQLTAAVTSRLIEENGLERLRAAIGQRYYLPIPRSPSAAPPPPRWAASPTCCWPWAARSPASSPPTTRCSTARPCARWCVRPSASAGSRPPSAC
jgi:LPS-assembly protein